MSFEYGFYNSINHDRKYAAEQVSRIFDGILTDGVYASIGEAFAVTVNSGMQLSIGSGRAWFNHTWSYNDTIALVTLPASHAVFDRIDAVVIEVNLQNRENKLMVVKGLESSTPTRPTLANGEGDTWQYPLAYVRVEQSVTEIEPSAIMPVVGSSECPFVTSVLQGTSIDNLITTWKDEFDILFADLERMIAQAASQTLVDHSVTFQKLGAGAVNLIWENVLVTASSESWTEDDASYDWSEDYPWYLDIALGGMTASYIPEVFYSYEQEDMGIFSNRVVSYDGGIRIFASDVPESNSYITLVEGRRVKA